MYRNSEQNPNTTPYGVCFYSDFSRNDVCVLFSPLWSVDVPNLAVTVSQKKNTNAVALSSTTIVVAMCMAFEGFLLLVPLQHVPPLLIPFIFSVGA